MSGHDAAGSPDDQLLFAFTTQVWLQCGFALRAHSEVESSPFDPWYGLQNFMNAVANLSKIFWGQGGRREVDRETIRNLFGVLPDSPIRQTTMRNHWEHFDNEIDRWWAKSESHHFIDINVASPAPLVAGVAAIDVFRTYDPAIQLLTFWGDQFTIREIATEVAAIYWRHPNPYV